MMIAALYVERGGVYYGLPNVDPWGPPRDARNYEGPYPVVAHPPCSSWCQLAHINQKRWGAMVGDDGGCFEHALWAVREFGGVLEHPAFSYAWPEFELTRPPPNVGWTKSIDGGWTCQVSQGAYGHAARKLTWLYYHGDAPPHSMRWDTPAPTAQISHCANHGDSPLPRISKKLASRSPLEFRDALLRLAQASRSASCGWCPHPSRMPVGNEGGWTCEECEEEVDL